MPEPPPDSANVPWAGPDLEDTPPLVEPFEGRNQKRLANFLHPQLQPDEQLVVMLSPARERPPGWWPSGSVAVVVTNGRLFVIHVGLTSRPKEILAAYARDDIDAVEWVPDVQSVGSYSGPAYGRLTLTGSFGTRVFFADGYHQFHASAIAIALERPKGAAQG